MQRITQWKRVALILVAVCVGPTVFAQEHTPAPAQSEAKAAWHAALQAAESGPQEIKLRDQALLKLPNGFAFIPVKEAARYMRAIEKPQA